MKKLVLEYNFLVRLDWFVFKIHETYVKFHYQNASFNHVHGRVSQDFLLNDAHGKLAKNAGGASLNFNLENKNNF